MTVRLAAGQSAEAVGAELERLLRAAAPKGAEVSVEMSLADPSAVRPGVGRRSSSSLAAMERACGAAPGARSGAAARSRSSPSCRARGIDTVATGFATGGDALHAPNESYRLESLRLGEASTREIYLALADLTRSR